MSIALVVLAAALPFAYVIACGFTYDDHWTIVGNGALRRPLGELARQLLGGVAAARGVPDASRPAMVLSNALDVHVFGLRPGWHHAVSLLWHVATSVSAYALAWSLTGHRHRALVAAVIFACAPLHAEVVASIHYREDLIATCGAFTFLACMLVPARKPQSPERAALAGAALLVALLGKESAVTAVVLLPVLGACVGLDGRAWSRRAHGLVATAAVLVLYGAWRFAIAHAGDGIPRASHASAIDTLLATARYVTLGALECLVPVRSVPIRGDLGAASAWWCAGPVILLVSFVLAWRARARAVAGGIALVAIAPLASSPLVGPANELADRFLYAGVLGGALILSEAAARLRTRIGARNTAIGVALIVTVLGTSSVLVTQAYVDDVSLFRRAVAVEPRAARAHTALAFAYRVEGRLELAERAGRDAVALDPTYARARLGLAITHALMGRESLAREELRALADAPTPVQGLDVAERCMTLVPTSRPRCFNGRESPRR